MKKAVTLAGIVILTLLFTLTFIGCSDSGGSGGSTTVYGEYVNIENTRWRTFTTVTYGGTRYTNVEVRIFITTNNRYQFRVPMDSSSNDDGSFSRDYNTAILTSDYLGSIGKADLLSPTRMKVTLNKNSWYPGTYYFDLWP